MPQFLSKLRSNSVMSRNAPNDLSYSSLIVLAA